MFKSERLKEKFIKKDAWVKAMRKAPNPTEVADLIVKRIEVANTGPYIMPSDNERPIDIVVAMINLNDESRDRITPAIGLILYKSLKEKETNHSVLRSIFYVIGEANLKECLILLGDWLQANHEASFADTKMRATYREALWAYAQIQDRSKALEDWWAALWHGDDSYFWTVAFYGLQRQNPKFVIGELRLIIERNIEKDKLQSVLYDMWKNDSIRPHFERALVYGVNANQGWGGFALNTLTDRLTLEDREVLYSDLNNIEVEKHV